MYLLHVVTHLDEAPRTFEKAVPANSRKSFSMGDDTGEKNASIEVRSDAPVSSSEDCCCSPNGPGATSTESARSSGRAHLALEVEPDTVVEEDARAEDRLDALDRPDVIEGVATQ